MALIVQDDAGTVTNANAYILVADFKSYHDDRGAAYGTDDTKIAQAIVRATDYIDSRFRFRGKRLTTTQAKEWPRQAGTDIYVPWWDVNFFAPDVEFNVPGQVINLTDASGNALIGIPQALKNACAEYALRAMSIQLFQDAPAAEGGRLVAKETVTVDVITHEVEYAPSQGTGTFQMPAFPAADLMLARAGLIEVGRSIFR